MVSLMASAPRPRGVQVYGQLPAPYRPPVPVQRPQSKGGMQPISQILAGVQDKEKAEANQPSGFGRGLGFLLNNPITQTALKPLSVLDYPRRFVASSAQELIDAAQGEGFDLGDFGNQLSDPTFGWGDIIPDTGNKWVDRAVGLTGDILADPLTWIPGVNIASKGGMPLSKANRASLAARLLDEGAQLGDVQRFVERGAGYATEGLREAAKRAGTEIAEPGLRFGTRAHNLRIPGTGALQEAASKGLGTTGDVLRNTRIGEKLAGARTPERIEDAYARLFQGKGDMSFRTAAERVEIEDTWRTVQNTFRNLADRQVRTTRRKLKGLNSDERKLLLRSIETGTPLDSTKLAGIRDEVTKHFDWMWGKATDAGVNLSYRQRYTPHILTRDAAKWIRDEGSDTADVRRLTGLVTEDLFDPSGVTMSRQFRPGQTININGHEVTLKNATIEEVNQEFRKAGMKFDFFESDPDVILDKYINMLSSDTGWTAGIKSRIGKGGGVEQLTEREMQLLGHGDVLGPAVPSPEGMRAFGAQVAETGPEQFPLGGSSKLGENDLDQIERAIGQPINKRVLAARQAEGQEISRGAKGGPKLTRGGQAKNFRNKAAAEEGRPLESFVAEDFEWVAKPKSPTKKYNTQLVDEATAKNLQLAEAFETEATVVEQALEQGRSLVSHDVTAAVSTMRQRYNTLSGQVNKLVRQQRAGTVERAQLEEWITTIDEFVDRAQRDLIGLNNAVKRDVSMARRHAVRDRMAELREESDRLLRRLKTLYDEVGGKAGIEEADIWTRRAKAVEQRIDELRTAGVDIGRTPSTRVVGEVGEEVGRGVPNVTARGPLIGENTGVISEAATPRVRPTQPQGPVNRHGLFSEEEVARYTDDLAEAETAMERARSDMTTIESLIRTDPNVVKARRALSRIPGHGPVSGIKPSKTLMDLNANSGKVRRLQAELAAAERQALEDAGYQGYVKEYERAKGVYDRLHAGLKEDATLKGRTFRRESSKGPIAPGQILGSTEEGLLMGTSRSRGQRPPMTEPAYSPEQLRDLRSAIDSAYDEGIVEELRRANQRAAKARGRGAAEMVSVAEQRKGVQEEIAAIAGGGPAGQAKRAEVTEQGVEQARTERLAKQAERRKGIKGAREWADPMYLQPRRRDYVQRLSKIDEEEAARMVELSTVLNDTVAQDRLRSEVQERLVAMNKAMTDERNLDEAGNLTARSAPKLGIGEDWVFDVKRRKEELESMFDLPDDVLTPEAKATVEKLLLDVVDTAKSAHKASETAGMMAWMANAAKNGDMGRVVEAKIDDFWKVADSSLIGDDVLMNQELRQSFQRIRDAAFHKDFWPVVDTFTNLFKTYATLTPGFHLRNAMSAVFMNASDGVPLTEQMRAARLFRAYRRAKNPDAWLTKQTDEVRGAFEAAFGTGIGGRYTEPGIGTRGSAKFRLVEGAFDNPATRWLGSNLGANVEGIARLAPALDTMKRGGSVREALMRATRLHFDYSQMSRMDKQARRLIPFWTFTSRNLPLQVSQMWMRPRAYAHFNSFVRNFRSENPENTPSYFGDVGAFPLADTELGGLPMFIQPDLPHTRLTEDLSRWSAAFGGDNPAQVLSDFNPLLTAPIEYFTGKDLYTGREYDETDVRATGPLEWPIAQLGRLFDQTTTTPGGQSVTSEKFLNAVRALIPVYDRAVRLAPGAVTGGASDDAEARRLESYLRFLGIPIRQLSPQQQQAQARSAYYDQANDFAMQRALAAIDQGGA
jgi:hypothetical protein